LKISLILPLFDRRTAGWKALESALAQTLPRDQYEIVVVIGRPFGDEPATDAHAEALLQRCDAVVRIDADPTRTDQEIPFLMAGYASSTGDLVFFMEGHTELAPECCAVIAAHFRAFPESRIAWAPRIHRSTTPLGRLVGMHSKQHERRVWECGGFWLGANSIITREYFEHLGRLDADYMRFCERVLGERVLREGVPIARLAMPLSIHHDDMPLTQLIGVAIAAGEARYRYYRAPPAGAGAGPVEVRHGIYLVAKHGAGALLLFPLARLLGPFLLRAAVAAVMTRRSLGYRLYVLGFGFADLSGYCRERIRSLRAQRRRVASLSRDAH
jgi:hypothetical protein